MKSEETTFGVRRESQFNSFTYHKVQSSMFKVQCNEKDIIHIHAFGNGAEHHGTASGSQKAGSAKGTTVEC